VTHICAPVAQQQAWWATARPQWRTPSHLVSGVSRSRQQLSHGPLVS